MANPTAQEQLILELINRARLDPLAEAARLRIDLNQGLAPGTISASQKQVLAFNPLVNDAADSHSTWMLDTDIFDHAGLGGSDPGDRMRTAGYVFSGSWTWGENIAWSGTTGALNVNATAAQLHDNLFRSAGHRTNILENDFREIGIGVVAGQMLSGGTNYNALTATEDFALSGANHFITGVVYSDSDANRFYSIGEGRGGVSVKIQAAGSAALTAESWDAGGYGIGTMATGELAVTFSGGGLAAAAGATVLAGAANIKLDLVGGRTIQADVTATISGAAVNLTLLGLSAINGTGSAVANWLTGNKGANALWGLGGNDRLAGGSGNDRLAGGDGNDVLNGGGQHDTLAGGRGADTFDFSGHFGHDRIQDFESGIDHLRFAPATADAFSDVTISGNGTRDVTVALGTDYVVLHGAAAFTLTADDFLF